MTETQYEEVQSWRYDSLVAIKSKINNKMLSLIYRDCCNLPISHSNTKLGWKKQIFLGYYSKYVYMFLLVKPPTHFSEYKVQLSLFFNDSFHIHNIYMYIYNLSLIVVTKKFQFQLHIMLILNVGQKSWLLKIVKYFVDILSQLFCVHLAF